MSECILTQNFDKDCADALGGIEEFYVIEHASLGVVTDASGIVTNIATIDGKKFQRYVLRDEVGSISWPLTHNQQNGTNVYEQTLTFAMDKLDVSKRNELQIMDRVNIAVIGKDNNGSYWLLGKNFGMYPSSGANGSGVAKGDRSGFERTYISKDKEMPLNVTAGIINSTLVNGL